MQALILGTGPSLHSCPHVWRDGDELRLNKPSDCVVIGINDVPTRLPCDWWVFADWASYWKWSTPDPDCERGNIPHHGVGDAKPFTKQSEIGKFERKLKTMQPVESKTEALSRLKGEDCSVAVETIEVPQLTRKVKDYARFSGPVAMMLAYHLEPERVECWGCEMAGKGAFNDRQGNRGAASWRNQMVIWSTLVEAFALRGVEVWRANENGELLLDTGSDRMQRSAAQRIRKWTYHNENGRVTQTFTAGDEADFRRMLEGLLGKRKAWRVQVDEV